MDIDFLAKNLSNDKEQMREVVNSIVHVKTENSFIGFELKSVEYIAEVKAYHGVRIKMLANIANTRTPFDIDVGIGDVVVPEVQTVKIPTQLEGFKAPVVASYSLESTIAEKLEAMFDRMEASSRMKDYYDIYYLACNYDFEDQLLAEAIRQTFEKRETDCDMESLGRITKMYQNPDMSRRWETFTKKSLGVKLDFKHVVESIIELIEPLIKIIDEGDLR